MKLLQIYYSLLCQVLRFDTFYEMLLCHLFNSVSSFMLLFSAALPLRLLLLSTLQLVEQFALQTLRQQRKNGEKKEWNYRILFYFACQHFVCSNFFGCMPPVFLCFLLFHFFTTFFVAFFHFVHWMWHAIFMGSRPKWIKFSLNWAYQEWA